MTMLRLRVEFLSFTDSGGRSSEWILKAFSSHRKDPAGSIRLPEAQLAVVRMENHLFGRWLVQQDPFQRAQQDGVLLEGWNVGLTFDWIQQLPELESMDDEMEMEEVEEPVVKRWTMQKVWESPSRREERAVEEATASFEDDIVGEEEVASEDRSRKRKAQEVVEVSGRLRSTRLSWTATDFLFLDA